MKTTKQKKGTTVETPKKNSAIIGCAGVKKSINKTGGRHQRIAGASPFSAAQVVGQQLPRTYSMVQQVAKEIPELDPKIGLHPSEKIKLQLFPIDEGTRIELEKDGHNPFLELTLSARKKISSVLKHLNSKWGSSSIAIGDPMLFPYNIQLEKRWSLNDNNTSAGDIYAALESPAIFRLRYGWFSDLQTKNVAVPSRSTPLGDGFEAEGHQKGCSTISELMDVRKEKAEDFKPTHIRKEADAVVTTNKYPDFPVDYIDVEMKTGNSVAPSLVPWDDSLTNLSIGRLLSGSSLLGRIHNCDPKSEGSKVNLEPIQLISSDISIGGLLSEASMQGKFNNHETKSNGSKIDLERIMDKDLVQSAVPWDDGLTDLSIGGLLSEASLQGKLDSCDPKSNGSKLGFQPSQAIADSLDAFIAGQLNSQPQEAKPPSHLSHSSILDAEETCHGFPFRKLYSSGNNLVRGIGNPVDRDHNHDGSSKLFKFSNFAEPNGQGELAQDPPHQESKTGLSTHFGVNNGESSPGLAEIKWNDSLGPFEFSLPTPWKVTTSADSVSFSNFIR